MASTFELIQMMRKYGMLGLIASINPSAWDVITRGEIAAATKVTAGKAIAEKGTRVALNPQPLPPKQVQLGIQQLQRLAAGAIASGSMSTFADDIDDWCGNGWPHRWPFPWPDPRGYRPDGAVYLGAAIAALELADHYPEGEMQSAFTKAAEQLAAKV